MTVNKSLLSNKTTRDDIDIGNELKFCVYNHKTRPTIKSKSCSTKVSRDRFGRSMQSNLRHLLPRVLNIDPSAESGLETRVKMQNEGKMQTVAYRLFKYISTVFFTTIATNPPI